ncbi:unnamed protein product [Orchesella dallaii]|uniref:Uncharacterized protein n=1 Tax=Orchesella dallaii TaxID=48710 RepID=A0ABP1RJ67_9HEXA
MILKAVDDKYGQIFQKLFPLANWLIEICSQFDGDTGKKCRNLPHVWKASNMKNSYKSWDSITKYDSKWNKELIANEKEYIWALLNSECQSALINRCEVPHVCERTFLDPEPRSQYFLTHQLLLRILIEQQSDECPSLKRFVDHDVNDQLCARMYKEAQLVEKLGYPHMLRDIFSEYVAFCGHLGYPNFFREDFLQNILSWQSRSDYGCFRHEKDYKSAFTTSDEPLKRVTTRAESEKGLESDEMCLPHFTAVGLSALAVNWDYMEENCV